MTTILGNEVASALGQFATGICLVTAHHQEKDYALVAASICTASLEPPHIVVSVGNARPILPALQDTIEWVVNVLPESCMELVRRLTAGEFEHRTRAFESTAIIRDPATGARLVTDALAYWRCRTRAMLPVRRSAGDPGRSDCRQLHADRPAPGPMAPRLPPGPAVRGESTSSRPGPSGLGPEKAT
jgi:hypothetical protein